MIKWIWEKLNCNKWSTYHPHDLLLCCQFSPNWWIDLVQSQTKSQESFFIEIEELIAKCMWKYKEPRITQPNFEKEEQGFWLTLLILRCTVHALCLITQSFSTEKSHSDSFWPYGLQPLRLLCHGNCPGKNTGVGCHALLWIFTTQGSNPGLPLCMQILNHLSHQGIPKMYYKWTIIKTAWS